MRSEVSFFGMLFYGKLQNYSRAQKQQNFGKCHFMHLGKDTENETFIFNNFHLQ